MEPEAFADISALYSSQKEVLACNRSQKDWHLQALEDEPRKPGRSSGRTGHADGWLCHSHLCFGTEGYDPVCGALGEAYFPNTNFGDVWK